MDPRRPESTRHPGGESWPHSEYERAKILGLSPNPLEVYCHCPADVARQRYGRRAAQSNHHPAHVTPNLDPDLLREFDQPIGIGKVIAVDTKLALNIDALARTVLTELADR